MKHAILTVLVSLMYVMAWAQPPLSKKDQQRKAAFEEQIANEQRYEKTLDRADRSFKAKDYVAARMAYEEAIQYATDQEQWLISKVNDLDILMARNAARSVDSVPVEVPQVKEPEPIEPKPIEQPMEELPAVEPEVPEEKVVENKEEEEIAQQEVPVQKEETALKEDPVAPSQTVSSRNIQMQPKAVAPKVVEEKVKEDFSSFDNGITEETFTLTNHSVVRIVVKEGIDVKVFKRVKHNWGGEYFFLDDMDVTRRYWEEQVNMYRLKYPK